MVAPASRFRLPFSRSDRLMAALLLSVAAAAAGGAVFGPIGAIAGRIVGALAGNVIDHALLSPNTARAVEGPRLSDLDVMASTEGAPIPRLYGRARVSRHRRCGGRAAAAGELTQSDSAALVRDYPPDRPPRADDSRGDADPGHDRIRL